MNSVPDSETASDADDHKRWTLWAVLAAVVLLVLFSIITIGALRGCFTSDDKLSAAAEKKKKEDEEKKKEEKAPFKIDPPVVLPSEPKVAVPPAKPGHWATAYQEMRSNYRDFVGDSRLSVVDTMGRSYPIIGTPFEVRSSRPVLLTKGRPKSTQTTFFTPLAPAGKNVNIALELAERGLGNVPAQARTGLTLMPSYQYHFVVLAKSPTLYSYVKTIDSVRVPFNGESDMDNTEDTLHYIVVELGADQIASLPDNPLTWTSIAYVLWDKVDPGEPFPNDQKKALVDWLHWGGQLIISGPDSLDTLKGSFLDPYLPALSGGTRKFESGDKDLAEFSDGWMISTKNTPGTPLQPTKPWSGIKLDVRKSPEVNVLPNTGGLFVERQVGRGRIVVSAIRLSERDFINWRSGFESFFNACLLRRPPRYYYPGFFGRATANWADSNLREHRLDASLNTNLFYFARDVGTDVSYHYEDMDEAQLQQMAPGYAQVPRGRRVPINVNPAPGQLTARQYVAPNNSGGVGAWNDFSLTANAARSSLIEAAGVEVPGAGFVVLCLAAYLVALVPINWIVFYTIGRVEWAWIAAPIIAIAGTWVIVQRARLDIGFVRAQTEIGILEQQPDYSRAHLSRYTALYTSLSTTYDFDFANLTTLIAPFPRDANQTTQVVTPIDFERYDHVRLTGLPISSNSTGMVHSEQMLPLDGPIRIGQSTVTKSPQVENHSTMSLHSACIVRQTDRGLQGRWIGDLLPGQSVTLGLHSVAAEKAFVQERADEMKGPKGVGLLNLEPIFRLALDAKSMAPGEMRLVGRVDEVLPGQSISPSASQVRGATLVVAHLQYGPPPAPKKDSNTKQDVKETDVPNDTNPIEFR